jgi:hypothetical protein
MMLFAEFSGGLGGTLTIIHSELSGVIRAHADIHDEAHSALWILLNLLVQSMKITIVGVKLVKKYVMFHSSMPLKENSIVFQCASK